MRYVINQKEDIERLIKLYRDLNLKVNDIAKMFGTTRQTIYATLKRLHILLTRKEEKSKNKIKVCLFCGKQFKAKVKFQKFCSKECFYKSKHYKVICKVCGKELVVLRSRSKRRFCSRECFYKWEKEICKGKSFSERKKEKLRKNCLVCGKEFEVSVSRESKKYCSWACYLKRKEVKVINEV